MADSIFWRDLAAQFRALPGKYGELQGERTLVIDEPAGEWHLRGPRTARVEFEALAKRGALHIPNRRSSHLLTAWLEGLAYDEQGTRPIYGSTRERNGPIIHTSHSLFNLPERSANYCKVLESSALDSEAGMLPVLFPIPPPKISEATQAIGETLHAQIHVLRIACKWSIEQLAAKTGFDERTVRRHLSGRTIPHLRNITVYEQAFSKALKKEIVINKTP